MKEIKVAPSILSADFSNLANDIQAINKSNADYVHIDIMDGHFVPNITFGPIVVNAIRPLTILKFDVHLMIENPDKYIDDFIEAGADIITVHVETCNHLNRTINYIKSKGLKAGVSLNPATPLSALDYILQDLDMVLLMTVNPGFGGQSYIHAITEKIRKLRETALNKAYDLDIEVDGGINVSNIDIVTQAGANVIVSGSAFFKSKNKKKFVEELREAVR